MLNKLWLALGLGAALLAPTWAQANEVGNATVATTCTGYTFAASGKYLKPSDQYHVSYWFDAKFADGSTQNLAGVLPVRAQDSSGDFSASLFHGWGPLPKGNYQLVEGNANLWDDTTGVHYNQVNIVFTPQCFTCTDTCSTTTQNTSNFNGTAIPSGDTIWFNSNFTGSNVPSTGATLYLMNQTITLTAGGKTYTLPVPNAQVTFSPSATCTTTTFDAATNTWVTTVPVKGDDEIFMSGLSYPVPAGFGPVTGNVNWNGTLYTSVSGVGAKWKWGASVYSKFTSSYNDLMVKAGHQTSCQYANGDHAGTPEGSNTSGAPWKQFVVGGARGGGGSNFTGSWSGTITATPVCNK